MAEISDERRVLFLQKGTVEYSADVLEEMTSDLQLKLIQQFKVDFAASIFKEMEKDVVVDILENLIEANNDKAEDIISELSDQDADDLRTLLSFEEGTAGSIMSLEYVSIPENLTVAEAIAEFKRQKPMTKETSFLFIHS